MWVMPRVPPPAGVSACLHACECARERMHECLRVMMSSWGVCVLASMCSRGHANVGGWGGWMGLGRHGERYNKGGL